MHTNRLRTNQPLRANFAGAFPAGAIWLTGGARLRLRACTLTGNGMAYGYGGTVYVDGRASLAALDCLFSVSVAM